MPHSMEYTKNTLLHTKHIQYGWPCTHNMFINVIDIYLLYMRICSDFCYSCKFTLFYISQVIRRHQVEKKLQSFWER